MKIKVIKKKDAKSVNKTLLTAREPQPREERREIVSTVSGWVNEFQQARGKKARRSFEQIFSPAASRVHSS